MSDIPWFKVDDTLHGHPKPRRAGLAAMGMWALAGSYSSQYVTEGTVPEWFVLGFPQGRKLAAGLVTARLWHPPGHDCAECPQPSEPGWQFHDWPDYQPSKAEIEEDRAHNRERQRRFREKRREAKRNAQDNADRAGGNAVTNAVSNAVSNGTPTRPDPTRPTHGVLRAVGDGHPIPNRHPGDSASRATLGLGGDA